jgi:gliding motility-associated-like protein
MKPKLYLLLLLLSYSTFSYSQCFDCAKSIGGHVEDYIKDIDRASDGVVLTLTLNQSWGRAIYKYDFNCNLIWSNTFQPDNSISTTGIFFLDTTLDENNNIYSIITNSRGSKVIEGFTIEGGNSLIKLNSNGNIEWVKKISDESYLKRKAHYWNDHIYVIGQLDQDINTNIGLNIPNGTGSQYFTAKFNLTGDLIDSKHYGGTSNEEYYDSQIDKEGNIYLTGEILTFQNHISHLIKIDSNLNLLWSKELSNNPPNNAFQPKTIYYNDTNKKLYIWSMYWGSSSFFNNALSIDNTIDTQCSQGSVLMEVSKETGFLNQYQIIDDCGYYGIVGNGSGDVDKKAFITHEGSNLFILSSFMGEIIIGNQTLTTKQSIPDVYNIDLILYKVNLTNFSSELILKSDGESNHLQYYDLAGPIAIIDDTVYLTSSYTSESITINGNTIVNNSGNNDRDVLFYKYNLDQTNTDGSVSYNNTCYSETTEFLINGEFDSVLWDFDDPTSGANNTSTHKNPNHIFSTEGVFNVTATVTCGTQTEIISTVVVVSSSPLINNQPDLYACENSINSGFSSNFNTSNVQNKIIGNQTNVSIEYYNENGAQLSSPLPNPMTNTTQNSQQITARVFFTNNPQCYTTTTFQLHTQPLPELKPIEDISSCDIGSGFSNFDITTIQIQTNNNENLAFYDSNYNLIDQSLYSNYTNIVPNQDLIYVRLVNSTTDCYSEKSVNLKVNHLPIANTLDDLIGCDDNNDGISNSFDTSTINTQVLGNQPSMTVTYYDQNNNLLPSPLPNPYTNTNPFNDVIRARVTNSTTNCFSETLLNLITNNQPNINKPKNVYACNEGNGFATFSILDLATQITGNQPNLKITYFDEQGSVLPDSFPLNFENTVAYDQLINVKVENTLNPSCFSDTSFHLLINEKPIIDLQEEYIICGLQESMILNVDSSMSSYQWTYEDGRVISLSNEAILVNEGNYILKFTETKNGIECENSTNFKLIRSELPKIVNIETIDLSSNNSLEINAIGDGEFEYSIDGITYQDNNVFEDLINKIYTVHVRDKNGCGNDSKEVAIIDYPKFFTPNNDGVNDFWQIKGLNKLPNAKILIFDRFGKILTELSVNKQKWYGIYNGKEMPSNDYWFNINLGNGRTFSGHFALKR